MGYSSLKNKSFRFWFLGFVCLVFGVFCALGAIEFFLTADDRIRVLVRQLVSPLVDQITHEENVRYAHDLAHYTPHTPPFPPINPAQTAPSRLPHFLA